MQNIKTIVYKASESGAMFALAAMLLIQLPLMLCSLQYYNITTLHAYAANADDIPDTTSEVESALLLANMQKATATPVVESAYPRIELEQAYVTEITFNSEGYYTNINGYNIYVNPTLNPDWDSSGHITPTGGVYYGPSGKETYYNLPMGGVVDIMRDLGYDEEEWPYWEREDGCKMLGDYIMVAADLDVRPRGSIVETSLGPAIVCDTGEFIYDNNLQLDIAVTW